MEILGTLYKGTEPAEFSEDEFLAWYHNSPPSVRRALEKTLEHTSRIVPNDGPQADAYFSNARILGYGGAAGGGKSALIAILALTAHLRTAIFRNDAQQLRGLVSDIVDFAGSDVGLNRNEGVFRLVAGYHDDGRPIPRIIEICGIGKPDAEQKYRGREHDLNAYDELTEIEERKVFLMQAWNRTAVKGQRVRALMTFNPPQESRSKWLIDYFAPWVDDRHTNPAKPGDLRYFYRDEKGDEQEVPNEDYIDLIFDGKTHRVRPISRTFIPALYTDNPHLGEEYRDTLFGLNNEDRAALALGKFTRALYDDPWQTIPTSWIDEAMERYDPHVEQEIMDAIGVDVARGGQCKTVIARRYGWSWAKLVKIDGADCLDGYATAAHIVKYRRDNCDICIDANAIGAAPSDILAQNYPVFPVKGQSKQGMPRVDKILKMYNWRTTLWWLARKVLDPQFGLYPVLPKDKKLRTELSAPIYMQTADIIQVEQKEKVVDRLGYSPDDADAVVTSLANVFIRGGRFAERILPHLASRKQADEFLRGQRHGKAFSTQKTGDRSWQGV